MRRFWVVVLTLLGAGLRVYQLTARSLWTDESITLIRIQHSWGDIFRNHVYLLDLQTIDTNPFVYFAALKLWALGAGPSEFALKLFSAWLGVLLIPLTYALGRRLFGHRAGLLAATFVLLSPGIEWYSHELRMYTLVGCLSALNGILTHQTMVRGQRLMVNGQRRNRPPKIPNPQSLIPNYIGLAISSILSIATHYTFVGQVVGLWGLVALGMWQQQRGDAGWRLNATQQRLGLALIIIAGVGAIGLSTSSTVAHQIQRLVMGQESDYFFVPLHMMWNSVINGFVFGLNAGDPTGGLFAWGLCVVAIWAFIAAPKASRAVLIAGGVMPLLVWFSISFIKSNFQGLRHMFLLLPYVSVALAGILTHYSKSWQISNSSPSPKIPNPQSLIPNLKSPIPNALITLILAAQTYGLVGMFTPSEHWHDDWRSVAQHVRGNWLSGDVLLLNSQTVHGAIELYAPGLAWEITPPVQTNQRDQADTDKLRTLSQSHRRIWFVHEKPNNSISAWLRQNAFFRGQMGFPARNTILQAELYDTHPPLAPDPNPPSITKDTPPVQWVRDEISPIVESPNPHPTLHVRLFLRRNAAAPPSAYANNADNYAITYRLIDPNGQTWLNWRQPIDLTLAPPAWGADAATALYWVDVVMPVPLGLPVLPYRLQVLAQAAGQPAQRHERTLDAATVARLFRITQWPASQPFAEGGAVSRLLKHEFASTLRPGDYLPLALTWQVGRADTAGWTTQVRLAPLPLTNGTAAQATTGAAADLTAYVGQPLREQASLQVPPTAPAGWYWLGATRQRGEQTLSWHWLGLVQVRDYAPAPLPPPSQVPINAKIGELSVLGYDVDTPLTALRPGSRLQFHTQWRVNGTPSRDGVLFLHILGPDGKLAAQHDSPPITPDGLRPTQTYRAGEGIQQPQPVTLRADAPPGEYRILLGVYDLSGGQRWPALRDGAPAQDDLVELGRFVLGR